MIWLVVANEVLQWFLLISVAAICTTQAMDIHERRRSRESQVRLSAQELLEELQQLQNGEKEDEPS